SAVASESGVAGFSAEGALPGAAGFFATCGVETCLVTVCLAATRGFAPTWSGLVAGIVGFAGAEATGVTGAAAFCAACGALALAGAAAVAGFDTGGFQSFVAGACAIAAPAIIVISRRLLVSFIPSPLFLLRILGGRRSARMAVESSGHAGGNHALVRFVVIR